MSSKSSTSGLINGSTDNTVGYQSISQDKYDNSTINHKMALDSGSVDFANNDSLTSAAVRHICQRKFISNIIKTSCSLFFLIITIAFIHQGIEYSYLEKKYHSPEIIIQKTDPKEATSLIKNAQTLLSSPPSTHKKHHETRSLPPNGCEFTILIIRHCEKLYSAEHCNPIGYERAQYLTTLFGNEPSSRWPPPARIVAMSSNRGPRTVYREIETVQPLAKTLGLEIQQYDIDDTDRLVSDIFDTLWSGDGGDNSNNTCSQMILISWEHSLIPTLAQQLGCGPDQGCPLDYLSVVYDDAWELQFVFQVETKEEDKEQESGGKWMVFGSVQEEGFDPLYFEKQNGGFGGENVGGGAAGVNE